MGVDILHDVELMWPEEARGMVLQRMEEDFVGFLGQFLDSMFPADADPALVQRVHDVMTSADVGIATALMEAMFDYDPKAGLADCPVPVRCINAADGMPTNIEGNRKYAPTFDALTMDGVGHFLMMERPEEFNALLRTSIAGLVRGKS